MTIINVNGNPYTTAAEDMRLKELHKQLRERLAKDITRAMRQSRDGTLNLNLQQFTDLIDQAYYMGREDA